MLVIRWLKLVDKPIYLVRHNYRTANKVLPQFVNAKLVPVSPMNLGLMNGDYIELVSRDYNPTNITFEGYHLVFTLTCPFKCLYSLTFHLYSIHELTYTVNLVMPYI